MTEHPNAPMRLIPSMTITLLLLSGCAGAPAPQPTEKKQQPPAPRSSASSHPQRVNAPEKIASVTGETFSIGVPSNASVGWLWVPTFDGDLLSLERESCEYPKNRPPMPGASCEQTFVFLAKKPGTTTVTMTRMFRGGPDPEHQVKHFTVTISK